jgi:hypothetical protein
MTNKKQDIKNLTATSLKKEAKKLDAQTEHSISVGENEYKIKIDDKFRNTKQHKLLDNLVEFLNQLDNKVELIDLVTPYISLLFIKHFTNVEISDDIDEAVDMLQVMIDLEILAPILNKMPEEETAKVYDLIATTVNRMRENMEELSDEADKISEFIKNREVLNNGESESN